MSKTGFVGTNGQPCHQDRTWLESVRQSLPRRSLSQIADEAHVTTHTIRKWLRIHGLQFTRKEVAEYTPIWNKGRFGYHTSLRHSEEHLRAIREARSGPRSNWWKGGVDRGERRRIADWCQTIRARLLKVAEFKCKECEGTGKLELDHIEPVYARPDLAYAESNIQVLCEPCHDRKHRLHGDPKIWRARGRGNTLVPRWTQVTEVAYLGLQDTYDLEVEHDSHNYVANRLVVHNSQRYAVATQIERVRPRRQDLKNRQSSHDDLPPGTLEWFERAQDEHFGEARKLYDAALEKGIAKESARFLLPLATGTTIYMKGSVRDWIHYINLRTDPGTQSEHRDVALACKQIFIEQLPVVADALGWQTAISGNGSP